ncbi:hypothetical protein RHGRI_027107 [Rhododendron griersonianum]|uniref:Uncharacterized protein n=1 Tax=Rhododendron griersonianum TaxID=479676 RepID=A0AAV6IWM0_9ERIC|nr:hypothetical protein RHGRI_027107 [Rhododendron griersonianum]
MGNAESNARGQRQNTAKAVGAIATVVAAVALAVWGLTKLVSSSASEEDKKTNDKGKLMGYQIPRNKFEDSPYGHMTISRMKRLMRERK